MLPSQSGSRAPDTTRTIVIVVICFGVLASAALAFRLLKSPKIRFETDGYRAMDRSNAEGKLIVSYQHVKGTERSLAFERKVLAHPKVIAERDRYIWLEGAFDANSSDPLGKTLAEGIGDKVKIRLYSVGMVHVLAWDDAADQLTPERFLALLAAGREGPEAFGRFRAEREAELQR